MPNDLTVAWRLARSTRWLTSSVVLTLGCGVGVVSALLSLAHSILDKPLGYPDRDTLVVLGVRERQAQAASIKPLLTGAEVLAVEGMTGEFSSSAWFELWTTNPSAQQVLSGDGLAERLNGALVSPRFFEVIGIPPALGRSLGPGDDPSAIVISHSLWRRRFAASPEAIGGALRLDGSWRTVVGVMPEAFEFTYPRGTDFWTLASDTVPFAYGLSYHVFARRKPHVTVNALAAALVALSDAPRQAGRNPDRRIEAMSVEEWIGSPARHWLDVVRRTSFVLLAATVVNVALLLLARSAARLRDARLRVALGARRAHLLRQVVAEVGSVGTVGTLVGVAISWAAIRILVGLLPESAARSAHIGFGLATLHFTMAVGLSTTAVSILLAAAWLPGRRQGQLRELRTAGARFPTGRRVLLATHASLTLVLVVGACVLVEGLWKLSRVDLGFQADGLRAFQTRVIAGSLARSEFEARGQHQLDHMERGVHEIAFDLRDRLSKRMKAVPGVQDVAVSTTLPFWDFDGRTWVPQSRMAVVPNLKISVNNRTVTPEFFRVFQIRVVEGRPFDERDVRGGPLVAIVSVGLAEALFGDRPAVGQTLHWGDPFEIVGVVGDVRWVSPEIAPVPAFYLPAGQHTPTVLAVTARTSLDGTAFARVARAQMAAIAPQQPVDHVVSIDDLVRTASADRTFVSIVAIVFGVLALAIGGIGTFGAMEAAATERRREVALRIALGSGRWQVAWLVVRHGLTPVAIGAAVGAAVSAAVVGVLRAYVFDFHGLSGLTLTVAVCLLLLVSGASCWWPARRAASVEPMAVLKPD